MLRFMLAIFGAGFATAGICFGRASWVGVNGHSVPVWLLLESLAAILLLLSLATHFIMQRTRVVR